MANLGQNSMNNIKNLYNFFFGGLDGEAKKTNLEYAFTVLEMICWVIDQKKSRYLIGKPMHNPINEAIDEAIDNINRYLREGGVGYQYVKGQLVPTDDENVTSEFVVPAISILNQAQFSFSYKYIQQAFECYRNNQFENAVDNTLKGCEALLKYIYEKKISFMGKKTVTCLY